MTQEKIISDFIYACPIIYLTYAIQKYSERVKQARSIKEQVFLETSLAGLKDAIKFYYN